MQNKAFRSGPIALTATLTTNILNPPTATGGVNAGSSPTYLVINHVRIINRTSGAVTFSMWLGLTGANTAGTEVIGQGVTVAPNGIFDYYGALRIDSTNFLVGGASVANALTALFEGEIGVAG